MRCQVREPTLDMKDFTEETILMNDPLFSHEVLADYHTKLMSSQTKVDEK